MALHAAARSLARSFAVAAAAFACSACCTFSAARFASAADAADASACALEREGSSRVPGRATAAALEQKRFLGTRRSNKSPVVRERHISSKIIDGVATTKGECGARAPAAAVILKHESFSRSVCADESPPVGNRHTMAKI